MLESLRKRILGVIKQWMMDGAKSVGRFGHFAVKDTMWCPWCGTEFLQFDHHHGEWQCLVTDCRFTFPEELEPPTPEKFKEYLERKELDKRIEMFLNSE
jgi:hypothetical protein